MPQDSPTEEQRQFIRHSMCLPLCYRVVVKGGTGRAEEKNSSTINVCRRGLLFSAKSPVDPASLIILKIPFAQELFEVTVRVAHCEQNLETGLYDIGVCFLKFSDSFRVKLIEEIFLISEYRNLLSIQLGRDVSLREASKEWVQRYSKRFEKLYW